ncbi:hypothetical protein NA56DRAFT_699982 [Hyaloscypha hepaticicola]|uniref:Uncharacterized protein n=1 Tax=Hyaloscypha hepaticicola TaxID=2082293 RepID=A0A2J6QFX0_9HELO|nr:hypothetical protein NA56DRAFT_699982 [Hyaloscypha hepaticicola]
MADQRLISRPQSVSQLKVLINQSITSLTALPIVVTGYISNTSSSSHPIRVMRRSKPNMLKGQAGR